MREPIHSFLPRPASIWAALPLLSLASNFSLAGNAVQKKRAAMSSENVNRLVCLSN